MSGKKSTEQGVQKWRKNGLILKRVKKKKHFLFSINKSLLKNQIYMKLFSMLYP